MTYLHAPEDLCEAAGECDVVFFPCGHLEPVPPPTGTVFHLADVQEWFFPENFSDEELCRRRNRYRTLLAHAAAVFVPSEFSRRCVVELLGFESERVFCVPVMSADLPDVGVRPNGFDGADFLYFPADDYPHKNHARLVTALRVLNEEGLHVTLVCTGSRVSSGEWLADAERQGLSVRHLGRVSREEVRWLYDHARGVVMPSCFEGFGIPLLEAFHCGVPVAASEFSSLAEVGAGAVEFFDPFLTDDIAKAVRRLWTDENLRRDLVARGKKRLGSFSARRIIDTHAAAFAQIKSRNVAPTSAAVDLPRLDASRAWSLAGRKRPPLTNAISPKKSKIPGALPEIHFFTLVLNGMHFLDKQWQCLRQIGLPFRWHLVEGLAELKADTGWSVERGGRCPEEFHRDFLSIDGTTDFIDKLVREFPDIVVAHRTKGAWAGKTKMCEAVLSSLQEEVLLWQLDADEFWPPEMIREIATEFAANPEWQAGQFRCRFHVSPSHILDSIGMYGNNARVEWRRLWRYRPGDTWHSHEPPVLARGGRDLFDAACVSVNESAARGWIFDHLAYVEEDQVRFKESYYGYRGAVDGWRRLCASGHKQVMASEYLPWVPPGIWTVGSCS